MPRLCVRVLCCLSLFTSLSAARTIYVNNLTGDNRNQGTLADPAAGKEGPVRSITRALRLARRGDRVDVANTGKVYEECLTLQGARHSGYTHAPFVLNGNGAILDGGDRHPVGITLYDVQSVIIQGLHVRRFRLDGVNAHDNVFHSALVNLVCERNGRGGVSVGGASRLALVECRAHRNAVAQLRTEGWSTTQVQRTKLVAETGPAWIRQLDGQGRGARLLIDGQLQRAREGFSTPDEWEELLALEKAASAPPADVPPPANEVTAATTDQPSAAAEVPLQEPTLDTTDPFDVDSLVEDAGTGEDEVGAGGPLGNEDLPAAPADDDPFTDDIFDEPADGEPADDPFEI